MTPPASGSGPSFEDRVYGCLAGLAVGDALGAPTEGLTRAQIAARYGEVDDFVADDPAGTDDTEYAVLTAELLLRHGHGLTAADVTALWQERLVRQQGPFLRGGFSETDAVGNLRRGLGAPASGQDNHEAFSDGAAMRAAPIGAFCPGAPEEAARLAGIEASVSHDRDGVWCSQAIAASVAVAMTGVPWQDGVAAGLAVVPEDSWSARCIRHALDVAGRPLPPSRVLDDLEAEIAISYYPWADAGPEATALAYAVLALARGDLRATVLGGANLGRDADTIAAMGGALAGALHGGAAIPPHWRRAVERIRGSCIRATAGTELPELAARLATAATSDAAGDARP